LIELVQPQVFSGVEFGLKVPFALNGKLQRLENIDDFDRKWVNSRSTIAKRNEKLKELFELCKRFFGRHPQARNQVGSHKHGLIGHYLWIT
jgi:hypothetical protein